MFIYASRDQTFKAMQDTTGSLAILLDDVKAR